jgi:hypothetical protein
MEGLLAVILRRPVGMVLTLNNFNCVAIGSPKTRGGSGRRFLFSGMVRLGAAISALIFPILAATSKAWWKRRSGMRRVLTRLKKDDLVWLTDTDALRKAPACIEFSPRAPRINAEGSCREVIMTISGVVRDRRGVGPMSRCWRIP